MHGVTLLPQSQRPTTADVGCIDYLRRNRTSICVSPQASNKELPPNERTRQKRQCQQLSSASCPGMGGSPTARKEYIALRTRRRSEIQLRRAEVKERKEAHMRDCYERKLDDHRRREQRRQRHAMELRLKTETEQTAARGHCWNILVTLCIRLEAMRELLHENWQFRLVHRRRKEAAVKIATWYKDILVNRRRRALIESCCRMHQFSAAVLTKCREKARRRCAERILDFMKREVSTATIATAVHRLKRHTVVVQRCWRTRVAARETQVSLLSLQFNKFEGRLLQYNKRKATANNVNVLAAVSRKNVPLHEELKMTLAEPLSRTSRERRVRMDDDEHTMTPEQMLLLSTLTVRLPKSIKDQVVEERLAAEVRRFHHAWDRYVAEKKVYATQKSIDDARLNLLKLAGLQSETGIQCPIQPHLRVIQSPSNLAAMIERGLRLLIESQQTSTQPIP